jgi:hypothetical protein
VGGFERALQWEHFEEGGARAFAVWVAGASRALVWRLAETSFTKVRDDETSLPARETRALLSYGRL